MSNRLASYVIAGALVSALALASPALARGGGMGIGGGGHMGGGWGGGMGHSGMVGGGWGGGIGHSGMVGHPSWGVGPHVGARSFAAMPMSRAAMAPRFSHAAFVPHHPFFFHHRFHRFNRFAFVGGPFFFAGYDSCWRRVWTAWGPQWINVCSDYSWGY